jgi:hypothetical protein
MKCKYLSAILIFSMILIVNANAGVDLYLCPPSPAYFSSLNTGDNFTVEVVASAGSPGVTMITFTVTWTPQGSASFVRPMSESSQELVMTGFFPQSSFNRFSGIAPDWTSQSATGMPGSTPEISVFTAPALNSTDPDSLARITFKKLSSSYPTFGLTGASAAQSDSTWVSVTAHTTFANVDAAGAEISGVMLPQATSMVVNIGGRDYTADVIGNTWKLNIKSLRPSLAAQPINLKVMRSTSLLTSLTIMDMVRSNGWYQDAGNHSEHPGDGNGDGIVNALDLAGLALSYGSSAESQRYDFRYDFNADGFVNLADLLMLGQHYGR